MSPSPANSPALDPTAMADRGPHGVGLRTLELSSPDQASRPVNVDVYYPALVDASLPVEDAAPDRAGAPYPVVLGDVEIAPYLAAHLASHGFVYVAGRGQRTWGGGHPSPAMIDYPLDLMTALDGFAALEDDPLAGLGDTERAGAIGYSFGSWTALMLAGARVDPEHIRTTCAVRPEGWPDFWWTYVCGTPKRWDAFYERAVEAGVGVATETGLWRAIGDERIRAVVPMMPEGFDLTGPRGLASVGAETLFLASSGDTDSDYRFGAVALFEHLPAGRAQLVTFVGGDHLLVMNDDGATQIRRLTTLFLAAHLAADPSVASAADVIEERWIEDVASTLEAHPSYETLTWGAVESR